MKTLLFVFAFVLGISAAPAMPLHQPPATLIIPTASGCGLGVQRGALDGCYPVRGYTPGTIAAIATTTTPALFAAGYAADAARTSRAISMEYAGWPATD